MNKTWTNKDIERLKKYYPIKNHTFLEKIFNKKMSAIRTKAMRMKIKRVAPYNCMKNNGMWKGDEVGYKSLHQWVKKHKPKPKLCEDCHKDKPFDLANISGKYKRDVNDFRWLCRSCHMKEDGRLKTLQENHRRKVIGEYYQCSKCKKMLPKKLFYYFNGDKYSSRCKDCYKFYRKSLL